jgi:hypothetical protein
MSPKATVLFRVAAAGSLLLVLFVWAYETFHMTFLSEWMVGLSIKACGGAVLLMSGFTLLRHFGSADAGGPIAKLEQSDSPPSSSSKFYFVLGATIVASSLLFLPLGAYFELRYPSLSPSVVGQALAPICVLGLFLVAYAIHLRIKKPN